MIALIPPPLLFAACGLTTAYLASFKPSWGQASIAAGILVLLALLLAIDALLRFKRHKTTLSPITPANSRTLVTSGSYRFSRNPMYLSLLCCLIALALVFVSTWGWLPIGVFVYVMSEYQIKTEEQALADKFGEQYQSYRQKVRRWI